jgi:hypothetical protein
MAHIGTWSLNDLSLKDLIKIAVKPQTLQKVEIEKRYYVGEGLLTGDGILCYLVLL